MTTVGPSTTTFWEKIKQKFCCCVSSQIDSTATSSQPARFPQQKSSSSFPETHEAKLVSSSRPIQPLTKPAVTQPSVPPSTVQQSTTDSVDTNMQRPTSITASSTPQKPAATNGTNGLSNSGYFSPPSSPSIHFGGSTRGSTRMTSSYSALRSSFIGGQQQKSSIVRDTAYTLKRKSASELGAGISETADNVSFIHLVEWIRSERLQTLPHKGSRWDTVLIRALYFAERLHGFETGLKAHASETEHAAHLGYGHIRLLLEVSNSANSIN